MTEREPVPVEERDILLRTEAGELHSYARDEIGFIRAGSGAVATSAVEMWILAGVFAVVTAFSLLLVAAPTSEGKDPLWGALFLTLGGVAGSIYAARLARADVRAKRVRHARGVPEPSSRQMDW